MKSIKSVQQQSLEFVVLLLGATLLVAALSLMPVFDYYIYVEGARAWMAGSSRLYDPQAAGFYYAPWAMVLLVPLSFLPNNVSQAIVNLLSALAMVWSVRALVPTASKNVLALALLSPWMLNLLLIGQWDCFIIAGLVAAWIAVQRKQPWWLGMALLVVATKPTYALIGVLLVLSCLRDWHWREGLKMLVLPLLVGVGSLLIFGWDWPLRYLFFVRDNPPEAYSIAVRTMFGLPLTLLIAALLGIWWIWRPRSFGLHHEDIMLALLMNLIISPYLSTYHLVVALPAHAWVMRRSWVLGLALSGYAFFAFTLFFLRISLLPSTLYLLGLMILMLIMWHKERHAA
ncbi:MAG: DUF2029 domain-containing protein [Oscillochloris sp.]|nr:DUF2029 domain-containing protein [Oscillochloris sp.]